MNSRLTPFLTDRQVQISAPLAWFAVCCKPRTRAVSWLWYSGLLVWPMSFHVSQRDSSTTSRQQFWFQPTIPERNELSLTDAGDEWDNSPFSEEAGSCWAEESARCLLRQRQAAGLRRYDCCCYWSFPCHPGQRLLHLQSECHESCLVRCCCYVVVGVTIRAEFVDCWMDFALGGCPRCSSHCKREQTH